MTDVLFWASVTLVVYPYSIYPAVMTLIGWWRSSPAPTSAVSQYPTVSVIVAAFNEATWIARKIESTLTQDYPPDRLEIIVVSDGSTDATADLVAAHPDSRVRLVTQEVRHGKSLALNSGVHHSRGEILVFTDANAMFHSEAIARLVQPFADPAVGLVSGQGLYGEVHGYSARAIANGYVGLEARVKAGEAQLGFIPGADGAIYALRRDVYQDVAPRQVNDLLHPISALLAGYVSRFQPAAFTVEQPSAGAAQELERHTRIIAQGFSLVAETLPILLRHGHLVAAWMLLSHRVLRWTSAGGLVGALVASWLGDSLVLRIALLGQGAFYALALLGWAADRAGRGMGLLAAPYYFCVVSIAGILGFRRYLRGGAEATWRPRGVIGDALHPPTKEAAPGVARAESS
jgi:cellulose synthase/poly-beta-1,6-N-acetylglucosamine synthase-like glycosyltransferase